MSERFFYCPDGSVINARQIGAMHQEGFKVIGSTVIGQRIIAQFDSAHEAEEYLKFVSEGISTEPREKALEMCRNDIVHYLRATFKPFDRQDLEPILLDDIDKAVCIGLYSTNLALEVLGKLTKDGNILDFGNRYVLPDRPTRTAVSNMAIRFHQGIFKGSQYNESVVVDLLTSPYVPEHRVKYPIEWGKTFVEALICNDHAERVGFSQEDPNDPLVSVLKWLPVHYGDGTTVDYIDTTSIEKWLDTQQWKAPEERRYDFE